MHFVQEYNSGTVFTVGQQRVEDPKKKKNLECIRIKYEHVVQVSAVKKTVISRSECLLSESTDVLSNMFYGND